MKKNRALANTFPRNMLIFPYSQLRSNRLSPQQTRLPYVYQVKEIDWNLRQWCAPVYRRRWGAQTPRTVNFIVQKPKLKCISIPKEAESVQKIKSTGLKSFAVQTEVNWIKYANRYIISANNLQVTLQLQRAMNNIPIETCRKQLFALLRTAIFPILHCTRHIRPNNTRLKIIHRAYWIRSASARTIIPEVIEQSF